MVHCLKMDMKAKYTFVPLPEKEDIGIKDKNIQKLLEKWGLNLCIQEYLFNEPFHQYHRCHLAEAFFKDKNVGNTLKICQNSSWVPRGIVASLVEVKQIPCSVTNMSFFDKLKNPQNNVIHISETICKRYDMDIDGILISDNLRGMILDDECSEYNLYEGCERAEFIFRLFQMLVLGGELCQYEDELEPYLTCTKNLYKDLISVQMQEDSQELLVNTTVLEVVAKDEKNVPYFPYNPQHKRNVAFLLVDGDRRLIKTISHQSSGYFA